MPPLLSQYFWLICGLWFGISNGLFLWFRLRKLAREGAFPEDEATRFTQWTALSIFLPALVFWALQMSAGTGLEPNFLTWPSPHKQLALGFQVLLWIAMVVWVFPMGGADTLAKYLSAGRTKLLFLYTPKAFKTMTAATVVSQVLTIGVGLQMTGLAG